MGDPWFGAKTYGIGLSPKGAAGWISLGVYLAAMVATGPVTRRFSAPHWVVWIVFATLTIGFLGLMLIKGDRQPWRWRWGGR